MIKARLLVGSSLLAACVAVFWLDHVCRTDVGFMVLVLGCVCAGLIEFYDLVEKTGCAPSRTTGLLAGSAYVLVHWLAVRERAASGSYEVLVITLCVFAAFFAQWARSGTSGAIRNISATVFGFLYIPFLGCHVLDMRHLALGDRAIGEQAVISFILVAKCVDMGAYFVGKGIGRTPMSPVLSPKKTVEGLVGGLTFGVAVGLLLHLSPAMRIAPMVWTVTVCVAIGVAGQLGDLAESMLKRNAEVKDSSGTVPGLGGVLDVIDCLLVAAPVSYYLLLFGPVRWPL